MRKKLRDMFKKFKIIADPTGTSSKNHFPQPGMMRDKNQFLEDLAYFSAIENFKSFDAPLYTAVWQGANVDPDRFQKELKNTNRYRLIKYSVDRIIYATTDGGCVSIIIEPENIDGKDMVSVFDVEILTFDQTIFEDFSNECNECIKPISASGKAYVLVSERGELKLKSMGIAQLPFIEDNYAPEVVDGFNHVVEDLKKTDPCGRIALFDGPPGTGKTHLIRSLLGQVPEAIFVMTPSHLVAELSGPNFMTTLIGLRSEQSGKPIVFVIEDADHCLVPRGGDNMPALSGLLNLGDGIIGALLDVRIVCTTNAKRQDMDEALLRPGRLCRKIEVTTLTPKQASTVFKRLTGKDRDFDNKATLAEVYRLSKDNDFLPQKPKNKVGFT